jgi:hypothetical protein
MNWIDKCEHNCCANCTKDSQDDGSSFNPQQPSKSTGTPKGGKSSGLKKGTRKGKKASGPEDVPLPSIEADDREHREVEGSGSKRKGREKTHGSKSSSTNKRKK